MAIEHLRRLRTKFSDDIPDKVLHGGDFKVRRNWWQGVVGNLEIALNNGLVPPGLRQETEDFLKHYTSEEFHNQPLTTTEDIGWVNSLLDRILGQR